MRKSMRVLLPVLALPTAIAAAYAGGWAVVTVADLPDGVHVGQPTTFAFAVRQHGVELMDDLEPVVEARKGLRKVSAEARASKHGHYTASLALPDEGEWKVTVRTGFRESELALMPMTAVAAGQRIATLSPVQRGQRLFVAKGCLTCHVHGAVEHSGTVAVGPALTDRRYPVEFLTQFLADPSIRRTPGEQNSMPNLDLKPAEIAALVAFLNSDRVARR